MVSPLKAVLLIIITAGVGIGVAPPSALADAKRELTPLDAISTVRVMDNHLTLGEKVESSLASPDGRRFLIRLVYGDAQRNGDWMDLMTGSLDSLEAAAHPKRCAHLFTTGLGSTKAAISAESDTYPTNFIRWTSKTEVAFLWSDPRGLRQVMSLNVATCKHRFLTHNPTNIFSFMVAPHGGPLLFNAQIPRASNRSAAMWKQGFSVNESTNALSILNGDIDRIDYSSPTFDNAWFLTSSGVTRPIDIAGQRTDRSNPYFREPFLSPNGRYAVIDVGVLTTPPDWDRYTSAMLQGLLSTNHSIPGRMYFQRALIDLQTGTSRTLWNAATTLRSQIAWSPDSISLILAPTFLPPDATDPLGLNGFATAELDVRSGKYRTLPIDLTSRTVTSTEWIGADTVEIRSTNLLGADTRIDRFGRVADGWKTAAAPTVTPTPPGVIRLEIRQSLNDPPKVFAINSVTGATRLILDPNPHLLETFKLGRVERISGTLPNGKEWIGQLMYPADYDRSKRYPLLIQCLYGPGFGSEEFALNNMWGTNGMGLGPSEPAGYPGQLLATHNIAVLQLLVLQPAPDSGQAEDYQLAFETLAEQLTTSGLADRNKIALDGFSHNGYWVEYTLAHSQFPFAAALAVDNYDPSYFQSALKNWGVEDEQMNGGPAFGEGLQQWIARAPGFNAEHIHTPLRMINQSGGVVIILSKWEIFSRLRHLHKPVDMYVMPESDTHPSHFSQNPRQILAIQAAAIDWLRFWLTGYENPSPANREQYLRWRAFAQSQAASKP